MEKQLAVLNPNDFERVYGSFYIPNGEDSVSIFDLIFVNTIKIPAHLLAKRTTVKIKACSLFVDADDKRKIDYAWDIILMEDGVSGWNYHPVEYTDGSYGKEMPYTEDERMINKFDTLMAGFKVIKLLSNEHYQGIGYDHGMADDYLKVFDEKYSIKEIHPDEFEKYQISNVEWGGEY